MFYRIGSGVVTVKLKVISKKLKCCIRSYKNAIMMSHPCLERHDPDYGDHVEVARRVKEN